MSFKFCIFVLSISYMVNKQQNTNAPKANASPLYRVADRPFVVGAFLFEDMKMIDDLGCTHTDKDGRRYYHHDAIFECPLCGAHFKCNIHRVDTGKTKSCGCLWYKAIKNSTTTHGLRDHPLYRRWSNMKNRCLNPNGQDYKRYGGRGITVCDEWKNDFKTFYDWAISHGYEKGLELDRADNDKGYSPDNCRWIKHGQNCMNQGIKSHNTSGYKGVIYRFGSWCARISVNHQRISLGFYKDIIDAAHAYDEAAKKYHGEYACLNFPNNK